MPERPIESTFFRDSHDRYGIRWSGPWSALVARCTRHDIGTKDGPAISCGTFSGPRGNANLVARDLIALDIESNPTTGEIPIPAEDCARRLQARNAAAVIWTTHSHKPNLPRYRVLMPLSERIAYDPEIDVHLSACVAMQLGIGAVCDQSKFGAASLFFLPRHPEGETWSTHIIPGDPVDVGHLKTMALMVAQRCEQAAAEVAARRAANALPPEILARIEAYNAAHAIPDLLPRYDYVRDGNRWRSRYQHGIGATTILPDGKTWVSFSESDAAEGVGKRPARSTSQCACFGDAFALFTHYEHGGNFRRALNALPAAPMSPNESTHTASD